MPNASLRPRPVSSRPSSTASEDSLSRRPVLIVDDEPRILRFLATSLKLAGYQVVTAEGGEEALRIIASVKLCAVILDMLMSPVDGLDVLRRLPAGSNLPVIVMSARHESREDALRLGARAFLKKPFNPADAIREIEVILSRN